MVKGQLCGLRGQGGKDNRPHIGTLPGLYSGLLGVWGNPLNSPTISATLDPTVFSPLLPSTALGEQYDPQERRNK